MTLPNDIAGTAALAILESLLLALNDHRILPEHEIIGILKDAAAAQEDVAPDLRDALNAVVDTLINSIIADRHTPRRDR
jgi:hypothetical protein